MDKADESMGIVYDGGIFSFLFPEYIFHFQFRFQIGKIYLSSIFFSKENMFSNLLVVIYFHITFQN